ncbi:hypothetical protein WA577_003724 [Blastocystis sp. JDR]
MEVADGARQPDWLPYVPLTWRQLQRKTWFLTVFFPDREWTEEVKELVRKLIEYLREPENTNRLFVGVERCPRTNRLHAHIYIDFMRTMRMSRRLRNIQLPGEDFVLHPHVATLSGNNGEIQVILYVLKKETKIYGGVMGKDIFLYEEDGFIANLIHNAPNPLPPVSESCIPACIPTASCTSSSVTQSSSGKSELREVFEAHKDDILAGRWDLIPEFFLFMNGGRCEKLREMLDDGKEEGPLSHCRLVFISGPTGCGKTSLARDFAVSMYGAGNGLPFYMRPSNKWWDGYRGQPVVILDDPSVRRFQELEQEIKVWADRYPFIAELKGRSMWAHPKWVIVTSNYPLEELTGIRRNPTFFSALFRRTDSGRRFFTFPADYYKPSTAPATERGR